MSRRWPYANGQRVLFSYSADYTATAWIERISRWSWLVAVGFDQDRVTTAVTLRKRTLRGAKRSINRAFAEGELR